MEALERAISVFGSQAALAAAIHVKQGHIWHWLRKSKVVPAERVIPIYRATHGAVTPNDLRPDLYPDPTWLPPLEEGEEKPSGQEVAGVDEGRAA